jgi:anti-sigma-K factor RskA
MIVRTRDLAGLSSQKFYEVWLLDPATQKMLAVGVLPPSGNGDYEVTAGLMAGYSAVDVSLQSDDGNPAHSQTSVLRALL